MGFAERVEPVFAERVKLVQESHALTTLDHRLQISPQHLAIIEAFAE